MGTKIQAVKGMNDILPDTSFQWEWLEGVVRGVLNQYRYRNVRTPILELTGLFERGTGQTTDIVEKEMYSFEDSMNGDCLSLRPENTPGVVRASIEHNLTYNGPQRLYYVGPMFRHERPQRGRYRQFHQIGAEALGFSGPELDVELMLMVRDIFKALGLGSIPVQINSLGVAEERLAHKQALIQYLEARREHLDEDALRRLHSNPLRILDSKNPQVQAILGEAPQLLDFLGSASLQHFETVQTLLDACGMQWSLNPRLVRGLDYYSHTVFEFISSELGAQATVCGGGRYDGLFSILGGKPTPAVGWAMGMERLLDLLATRGLLPSEPVPNAYALVASADLLAQALPLLQELRQAGVAVQMHARVDADFASLKNQFKKANASGARFALIFAEAETDAGQLGVKDLRNPNAEQFTHSLGDAVGLSKILLNTEMPLA